MATIGRLQGGIRCRLSGEASESAKQILLDCKPLDFEVEEVDSWNW